MSDLNNIIPNVELGVEMDKSDIALVMTAKHERKLRDAMKEYSEEEDSLCRKRTELQKALNTKIMSTVETHFYFKKNKLESALQDFGCQVSSEQDYKLTSEQSVFDKSTYTFTLKVNTGGRDNAWGSNILSFTDTYTFYDALEEKSLEDSGEEGVNAMRQLIDQLSEKISRVREKHMRVSQQLRDLPAIERQVKGSIAEHCLNKSEAGREILQRIEEMVVPNYLKLPE